MISDHYSSMKHSSPKIKRRISFNSQLQSTPSRTNVMELRDGKEIDTTPTSKMFKTRSAMPFVSNPPSSIHRQSGMMPGGADDEVDALDWGMEGFQLVADTPQPKEEKENISHRSSPFLQRFTSRTMFAGSSGMASDKTVRYSLTGRSRIAKPTPLLHSQIVKEEEAQFSEEDEQPGEEYEEELLPQAHDDHEMPTFQYPSRKWNLVDYLAWLTDTLHLNWESPFIALLFILKAGKFVATLAFQLMVGSLQLMKLLYHKNKLIFAGIVSLAALSLIYRWSPSSPDPKQSVDPLVTQVSQDTSAILVARTEQDEIPSIKIEANEIKKDITEKTFVKEALSDVEQRMLMLERKLRDIPKETISGNNKQIVTLSNAILNITNIVTKIQDDLQKLKQQGTIQSQNSPSVDHSLIQDMVQNYTKQFVSQETDKSNVLDEDKVASMISKELNAVKKEMVDKDFVISYVLDTVANQTTSDTHASKLSQDGPDYALHSSGARVLRYGGMTSKVFVDDSEYSSRKKKRGLLGVLKSIIFDNGVTKEPPPMANPPEVSLKADNHLTPGSCWYFNGKKGFFTFILSKPVVPKFLTFHHVSPLLWPDYSCAPKNFEVWGMQLRDKDRSLLKYSYRRSLYDRGLLEHIYDSFVDTLPVDGNVPEGKSFLIANATTSILNDSDYITENFDLNLEKELDIVQIRFLDNYGNNNFTCFYHLSVHGQEVPEY
ncbi:hypothetical protein MP638_005877 [Amoeboaphelidium occidentale]|nr:hypothetical protein MP638_005877 [Amoeboaphelidium occidentale]